MLDPMYFEDQPIVIEGACDTVLSDTEFRKRSTGQGFKKIVRISPLRVHDIIEFRNDAILDV